jgi:hypothetical protein
MAEAIAALGVAVSIIQLIDFGSKMLVRLDEFHSYADRTRRDSKSFWGLQTDLRVLLDALRQTQYSIEAGCLSDTTHSALCPAVRTCRAQIEALDLIFAKSLPRPGDSWTKRTRRAIASLRQDNQVAEIRAQLNSSVQALTLHHVTTVVSSLFASQPRLQYRLFLPSSNSRLRLEYRDTPQLYLGEPVRHERVLELCE